MAKVSSKQGKTRAQSRFATVPSVEKPRSTFDRSCGRTTAFNAGDIIPIFVDEALPGDTVNLRMSSFARMLTPIVPVMDNMYMDFFFFAVPYRLVWDNWQKFNGEQANPGDSTDFLVPQFVDATVVENSLSDFFGIPIEGFPVTNTLTFNSLHHRAHNLIYNEWFRSQDLQDSVVVDKDDGPDDLADYLIMKRGKRHDYFSSCLPFPQKGTPVQVPLGDRAPVTGIGHDDQVWKSGPISVYETGATGTRPYADYQDGGAKLVVEEDPLNAGFPAIYSDLSQAESATVNEVRQSFQIQRMLERDARGGSRYTEIIRSHFGVVSPDQRLQRPEYLGGGSTAININPVAGTNLNVSLFVGDLGGFATQASSGIGFVKSFEEHCLLIGYVNVRAELTYQQGLSRMWSRQTRFDFFWPALSHIGEQAVLSKEIFADGSAGDETVFGYQERWAEYRYKNSDTTGNMRSQNILSLDIWHLALDFETRPLLNEVFIEDNPPVDRVVAVVDQAQFKGDFWFDMKWARCMPTHSVPGLVDHF